MTTHPLTTPPSPPADPQQLSTTKIQKGSTTEHDLPLASGKISYTASADWMILRKKEKPIAEMFHVAYTLKTDAGKPRPVTFVFNGGPGAASAYLHVGAVGPRRVQFTDDGSLLPPPSRLIDNESTWLTFTDLVFVDPIGTGFSRTIDEEAPSGAKPAETPKADAKENDEFYQITRDIESLGEFMSRYLSKNNLWSRPIFIAGESYGGFRVGKLAKSLQEGFGIGLNGAILISPALELSLLDGSDYDVLMWSDLFPSMVAASVHHGRSKAFSKGTALEKFLPEVEKFATNEWLRLLALGAALPDAEARAILDKAAAYLGLPQDYVDTKLGRISHVQFTRELLRDQRQVIGLYDATMTALDPFPDRDTFQGADPTLFAIERVFTGGINVQLREALKVQTDLEYQLLSMKVNTAWKVDRKHAFETQIGATDDLRYAMALNPHMKVYLTHGYYDLVTPYFSSGRIASLMKLTPEQKKNLTVKNFKGGHMFYAWKESREAFKTSLETFYKGALHSGTPLRPN